MILVLSHPTSPFGRRPVYVVFLEKIVGGEYYFNPMKSIIKRLDHQVICGIVEQSSKVLDLGCGNGDLLLLLAERRGAKAQGG